jgi:3-oxoacyl-[acyl-carrier-protein] synthase II
MRKVAVTGLGIVSAVGNDPATFFANLMAGRSGIARLPGGAGGPPGTQVAAQVAFDPAAHFSELEAGALDRFSQFALVAAAQAIADAGLQLAGEDCTRIGVCLGTGLGGAQTIDDSYRALHGRGAAAVRPLTVLMAMNTAGASQIALKHALTGPNMTVSTACSSAAVAIGEAMRMIRHGYADVMVAGGTEALLTEGALTAWGALRTLANVDADDPAASCRPFSKDRSGLVLGEGAAIVVLEALEHAVARGASVHAELTGFGLSNDVRHIARPCVEGQVRAMHAALADAGVAPQQIDYLNAHGTATQVGDRVETAAIKQVFGDHAYRMPVSSTKAVHGHMMGATGAAEFIAAVLAITQRAVPPTANLRVPDPECDLDYVADGGRPGVDVRTVMSNSFAFGGSSAVLVARAFEPV